MRALLGQESAGLTGYQTPAGNFVAINPRTGNYAGVGAVEACHARDFAAGGSTTEAGANACAARAGYPNTYAETDTPPVVGISPAISWAIVAALLAVTAGIVALIVGLIALLPVVRQRLRRHP